jgi:hypothetical protein
MSLIAFLDLLQLPIIAGNDPAADRRTTAAGLSDKNTLPPENLRSRRSPDHHLKQQVPAGRQNQAEYTRQ